MTVLVSIWAKCNDPASMMLDNDARLANLKMICERTRLEESRLLSIGKTFTEKFCSIVVLPEYYFTRIRTSNLAAKAMQEDIKDTLITKLRKLSAEYSEILIIPGTIAFRKSLVRPEAKKSKTSTGQLKTVSRFDKMVNNLMYAAASNQNPAFGGQYFTKPNAVNLGSTALKLVEADVAKHGGPTQPPDPDGNFHPGPGIQYVQKNYHLYKNQAYVFFAGEIQFKYNKQVGFYEEQGATTERQVHAPDRTKTNTVTLFGKTFCFEICFDHWNTVAYQAMLESEKKVEQGFAEYFGSSSTGGSHSVSHLRPDYHIVISDSVATNDARIAARPGGYLIHASTNDLETCVKQVGNGGILKIDHFFKYGVSGNFLLFYLID